ncbi:MAG: PAS-domain containing protein [Kiloniellales bacterium]
MQGLPWVRRFLLRPAAWFGGLILAGTLAIVVYVEISIANLQEGLPLEVLRQQRDLVLVVEEMVDLLRSIETLGLREGEPDLGPTLDQLDAVEKQVAIVRHSYNFDNLIGASAIHAVMSPVVRDLRLWLTEGLYGYPPNSEQVLTIARGRIIDARQQVKRRFDEANDAALAVLEQEARALERFRGSLLGAVLFEAVLAALLIVSTIRQYRSELAAAAARRRSHDAIDSISGGIAMFDSQERLVLCNERYADLHPGARALSIPGTRFEEILRAAAKSGQVSDATGREDAWVAERLARFRNPGRALELGLTNGRWFRVTERRTSDGGVAAISTEITESRRREEDLRQLSQELQHRNLLLDAALANMVQGIAMFDAQCHLIVCNRRFLQLYDLPVELGRPGVSLRAILEASAAVQNLIGETAKAAVRQGLDFAAAEEESESHEKLTNGRAILIRRRPVPDGGWIATYEDITVRDRAERELRVAKEEADLANRTKSEFLANVSHELRTPLNAIIGFSEVIENEFFGPIGQPRYRSYVQDIRHSGTHLLNIINDILDISKIEAGKLELSEEDVVVGDVLRSAARLVEERAQAARIQLELEIADDLPALRADARALKQIFLNLLSNAVKFTEADGRVALNAGLADDGCLVVAVRDTGIGIAAEDVATALAPFGQVESALNRKYQGTGLGLPLAQRLTALHGGVLTIVSEPGKGTEASVSFPAARLAVGRQQRAKSA